MTRPDENTADALLQRAADEMHRDRRGWIMLLADHFDREAQFAREAAARGITYPTDDGLCAVARAFLVAPYIEHGR